MYFIGVGPGDPRLLTLRGAELMRRATCALGEGEHGLERVASFEEALLRARAGAKVARLFVGDPSEREMAEALAAGIEIEVAPGVTELAAIAAFAVPLARAGDASPSVAYARVRSLEDAHDWSKLAVATDALVIETDGALIPDLVATLTYNGRALDTPCAIVRDVSLPSQRVSTCTLETAPRGEGPAHFVVGAPVRGAVRWFDARPLFGKRILVLRAREQAARAADMIRERGAEPILVPAIELHPPDDPAPLARAVGALDRYGMVAFTSANGVDRFFAALRGASRDARAIRGKIAAIGTQTAASLAEQGVRADVVAEEFKGEGLAEAMLAVMAPGDRVLIPRAKEAREALPEMLRAAGHEVDVVTAYVTRPAPRAALISAARRADAVLLTSSSTATHFASAVQAPELVVASIGPITTATAEKLGLRVAVTAEVYTLEGTLDALAAYFAPGKPNQVP